MRPRLAAGGAVAAVAIVALARLWAFTPDPEMVPSFLAGDLLLILPIEPREGDVVAVGDPLDPARWTLRRVETIGGAVRYDGTVFRTSARPKVRLLDMGDHDGAPVHLEGEHLVSRRVGLPTRFTTEDVGVPDDAAFLSADARDAALDSRWWGPVPLDALQGVVVLRVGVPQTPWRGWIGRRGEPAVIPQSSRLGPPG